MHVFQHPKDFYFWGISLNIYLQNSIMKHPFRSQSFLNDFIQNILKIFVKHSSKVVSVIPTNLFAPNNKHKK